MEKPIDQNLYPPTPLPKKEKKELGAKYILLIGIIMTIIGIVLFQFNYDKLRITTETPFESLGIICIVSGPLAIAGGLLKLIFKKNKTKD